MISGPCEEIAELVDELSVYCCLQTLHRVAFAVEEHHLKRTKVDAFVPLSLQLEGREDGFHHFPIVNILLMQLKLG